MMNLDDTSKGQSEMYLPLIMMFIVFMWMTAAMLGFNSYTETGQHTGQVLDVNTGGTFFDTTTVELNSAYESTETAYYCVLPEDRSEMVSTLKDAQSSSVRVNIEYETPWYVAPWDCSTSTYITDIEVVG